MISWKWYFWDDYDPWRWSVHKNDSPSKDNLVLELYITQGFLWMHFISIVIKSQSTENKSFKSICLGIRTVTSLNWTSVPSYKNFLHKWQQCNPILNCKEISWNEKITKPNTFLQEDVSFKDFELAAPKHTYIWPPLVWRRLLTKTIFGGRVFIYAQ